VVDTTKKSTRPRRVTAGSRIQFDTDRMVADIALRGWSNADLARHAKVSEASVMRFLRGQGQTSPMCDKLARALGRSIKRYFVGVRARAVA
jgi:hypothetical protein